MTLLLGLSDQRKACVSVISGYIYFLAFLKVLGRLQEGGGRAPLMVTAALQKDLRTDGGAGWGGVLLKWFTSDSDLFYF